MKEEENGTRLNDGLCRLKSRTKVPTSHTSGMTRKAQLVGSCLRAHTASMLAEHLPTLRKTAKPRLEDGSLSRSCSVLCRKDMTDTR